MDDSGGPGAEARRRPRMPRGLLGTVALVLLIEAGLAWHEPSLLGIEPWDWRQSGRAASRSAARSAEILCFGDSLVKLGVLPRVIEARSGRGAYNLALCAGRAPASYFLLRRALEAGARPSALVVDFNASFLSEPPGSTARLYADLLRPDEAVGLAATARDPDLLASLLAMKALRSARDRFEVRREVGESLRGEASTRRAATASAARNWERNRGAQVMPRVAPLPADPAAWGWVRPSGWSPDPTNAAYVAKFFELAAHREIPVFWLLPPLQPGFAARQAEIGGDVSFDAFVEATARRFPGVTVVDARPSGYDASVFIDMAHLDRQGAATLSADLAGVIVDRLGRQEPSPRRVTLPRFADRPVGVALEDLAQSRREMVAR